MKINLKFFSVFALLATPYMVFAIQNANPVSSDKEAPKATAASTDATEVFQAKRAELKKKHKLKKKAKAAAAEKPATDKKTEPVSDQTGQQKTLELQKVGSDIHAEETREDKKK